MNIVSAVLAILLILILLGTSVADFKKSPQALEFTAKLKIPTRMLPVLGSIKSAAAVGLIIGFASVQFAVLVGVCLVVYFAVATVTHTRVKAPLKEAIPALVLAAVSMLYVLTTLAK